MKLAFENISGNVFTPTSEILEQGFEASRKSPRKRMILPLHRSQEAKVQRMYNFMQPGTYIRPHLHPRDSASESICVLQGAIAFFVFDDFGNPSSLIELDVSDLAKNVIDIEPNVWHSFLVLKPDTLLFETKMGPYSTTLDKTFADWAPEENSKEAEAYLDYLNEINQRGKL